MTDYFHLNAAPDTVRAISSLGLAHLGDGVFELMVRSWLCLHGKATSKGLHRATVRYVAAPAQARAVERILPLLTGRRGTCSAGAAIPAPTACPRTPAGRITRPPPGWRPCSAGCGFRAAQSGSTNCLL